MFSQIIRLLSVLLLVIIGMPALSVELLLSTTEPITIGLSTFQDEDLFVYDTHTGIATLFFDGSDEFQNETGTEDIDAAHLRANGNVILSTVNDAKLGGVTFTDGDLVEYDVGTNRFIGIVFAQSRFSVSEDTNACDILPNGNVVLSTTGPGLIKPLSFMRGDLLEYNGSVASVLFKGDDYFPGVNEQIDAVDVLANGNFVISVVGVAALPAAGDETLEFDDDDLVEFNPNTGLATLFFDGDVMSSQVGVDIDAIHVGLDGNL